MLPDLFPALFYGIAIIALCIITGLSNFPGKRIDGNRNEIYQGRSGQVNMDGTPSFITAPEKMPDFGKISLMKNQGSFGMFLR